MNSEAVHARASGAVEKPPGNEEVWPRGFLVPCTKWRVERLLGWGGTGLVYAVVKEPAGIPGAMKVMLASLAHRRDLAERFMSEAQMLAGIRHKNVVEVIDYDTLAMGRPFMVMELLNGGTLRSALRGADSRLAAKNIHDVFSQLCEGLHALHSQNLVHRDLKPENLFLHCAVPGSADVELKVLDLGMAGPSNQWSRHLVGTPLFMAPEQILGRPVTDRSDQYSAALVLFEMITGRSPWNVDAKDVEGLIFAQVNLPPPPPSRFCRWVSAEIDQAILRALDKDPGRRWSTVDQLLMGVRSLKDINDGSALANPNINTTVRTLATFANGAKGEREVLVDEPLFHDTLQQMDTPEPGLPIARVPLELFESEAHDWEPVATGNGPVESLPHDATARGGSPAKASEVSVVATSCEVAPSGVGLGDDPRGASRGLASPTFSEPVEAERRADRTPGPEESRARTRRTKIATLRFAPASIRAPDGHYRARRSRWPTALMVVALLGAALSAKTMVLGREPLPEHIAVRPPDIIVNAATAVPSPGPLAAPPPTVREATVVADRQGHPIEALALEKKRETEASRVRRVPRPKWTEPVSSATGRASSLGEFIETW